MAIACLNETQKYPYTPRLTNEKIRIYLAGYMDMKKLTILIIIVLTFWSRQNFTETSNPRTWCYLGSITGTISHRFYPANRLVIYACISHPGNEMLRRSGRMQPRTLLFGMERHLHDHYTTTPH